MRLIIPEKLGKELDSFAPYMEWSNEKRMMVFKEGTPENLVNRYKEVCSELDELRKEAM